MVAVSLIQARALRPLALRAVHLPQHQSRQRKQLGRQHEWERASRKGWRKYTMGGKTYYFRPAATVATVLAVVGSRGLASAGCGLVSSSCCGSGCAAVVCSAGAIGADNRRELAADVGRGIPTTGHSSASSASTGPKPSCGTPKAEPKKAPPPPPSCGNEPPPYPPSTPGDFAEDWTCDLPARFAMLTGPCMSTRTRGPPSSTVPPKARPTTPPKSGTKTNAAPPPPKPSQAPGTEHLHPKLRPPSSKLLPPRAHRPERPRQQRGPMACTGMGAQLWRSQHGEGHPLALRELQG